MRFHADLHIHSKYSRATSKQSDLEHFAFWAGKKGISVVATGDFTHPAWLAELKGKLDGFSLRVPTPNVSIVDLNVLVDRKTSAEEVNAAFRTAAAGRLKGILAVSEAELVSIDFRGNPHSSIIDAPYTKVMDGDFVKVVSREEARARLLSGRAFSALLVDAAATRLAERMTIQADPAGLHVLGRLRSGIDDVAACAAAMRRGVRSAPLSAFYLRQPTPAANALVLGYGGFDEQKIRRAVDELATALESVRIA